MESINDYYQTLDDDDHFYPPGCWPIPSPSFQGEVAPGPSEVVLYQASAIDSLSFVPPEPETDRFSMSHESLYLPPTPGPTDPTTLIYPRAYFPIIGDDESKDTRLSRDDYVFAPEHETLQQNTSSPETLPNRKDHGSKPGGWQKKSQSCDKAPEEDREGRKSPDQRKRKRIEALGGREATKRGKILERNRKASAKLRQRHRETQKNLSSLCDDQEQLHKSLSLEKSILEGQLYDLRRLALDHAYCDGSLIQRYIQNEAAKVVERAFCGRAPAPNSERDTTPHGFEEDAAFSRPAIGSHNLTRDIIHGQATFEVVLSSCI